MSMFRVGVPPVVSTVTASLKVRVTLMTSPARYVALAWGDEDTVTSVTVAGALCSSLPSSPLSPVPPSSSLLVLLPVAPSSSLLVSDSFCQSTLWLESWGWPVWDRAASSPSDRMVPPLSSREFSSTAMPWVEMFGSTTV